MPGRPGTGGRPPKSAAQHAADGTFRKDRHGSRAELQVSPAKLPEPPELTGEGLNSWRRIVDALPDDALTWLDCDALLQYCRAWHLLCELWPKLEADPTDKDARIAAFGLMDRCEKLGRQFGLTPQARMSLRLPKEDDEEDPLAEFVRRRLNRN